jgi:hypothetical protein
MSKEALYDALVAYIRRSAEMAKRDDAHDESLYVEGRADALDELLVFVDSVEPAVVPA